MWKSLFTAAGLLLLNADLGQAITWNFDEDSNAQGWQARELPQASAYHPILSSAVRDGIWRIELPAFQPDHNPGVWLVSPLLGRDSALFDRMVIRFRLVHTHPVEGSLSLSWTNSRNKDLSTFKLTGLAFYKGNNYLYTTDWQEGVISDLKTEVFTNEVFKEVLTRVWEGVLSDIGIVMAPYKVTEENNYLIQGPEEVPEAIEVDWIKLTGVEEQLQGELPPPVVNPLGPPGFLFSSAQFIPLNQEGIYGIESPPFADLDGDGDLDLILTWWGKRGSGLTSGENDGLGGFHPGHLLVPTYEHGPDELNFIPVLVGGADVNGDGRGDVFFKLSNDIELLLSIPGEEGAYVQKVVAPGMLSRGLADYDGDGDQDLWLSPATLSGFSQLEIWLNDGQGNFSQGPDFSVEGFLVYAIKDLDRDGKVDVVWVPRYDFPQPAIKISPGIGKWGLDKTYLLEIDTTGVEAAFRPSFIKDVGDYDGDGDVDAILVSEWKNEISDNTVDSRIPSKGLQLAFNDGTQHLDPTPWHGETVEILGSLSGHSVQAWDLDGDGLLDPVIINDNPRFPGVMVHLGRRDGLPVLEGYYDLPNDGRGVWAGDVDNDRDLDLVVIDPAYQGGGIHLLLNQSSPVTAVEELGVVLPAQSRLGSAYPNPFNPGVVIPFTLASSQNPVRLTIYNTLGQEVRQLELGVLPAGTHQVEWDGQDEAGKVLSSGVYLYRLRAGSWSAAGKMVKSE